MKNHISIVLKVAYAMFAFVVSMFATSAIYAQTDPGQGLPDHTVQCNCEQTAIVAPSTVNARYASTVDIRTSLWITSKTTGNMSVFANSPDGWCKAIPGPYIAYTTPTMPTPYAVTIECATNSVVKQSSISIQLCTPLNTCQTRNITLNITQ